MFSCLSGEELHRFPLLLRGLCGLHEFLCDGECSGFEVFAAALSVGNEGFLQRLQFCFDGGALHGEVPAALGVACELAGVAYIEVVLYPQFHGSPEGWCNPVLRAAFPQGCALGVVCPSRHSMASWFWHDGGRIACPLGPHHAHGGDAVSMRIGPFQPGIERQCMRLPPFSRSSVFFSFTA